MAFELITQRLSDIQDELRAAGLDGWLLYDFRARNTVAGKLTGLGNLTRRYFVYVPAVGEPQAISHKIEAGPWETWTLPRVEYSSWRELDAVCFEPLNVSIFDWESGFCCIGRSNLYAESVTNFAFFFEGFGNEILLVIQSCRSLFQT